VIYLALFLAAFAVGCVIYAYGMHRDSDITVIRPGNRYPIFTDRSIK